MAKHQEIAHRWASHEAKPFPMGHRTKEINGNNLTLLESGAASNIMTFINTEGRLLGRRQVELKKQVELLVGAIEELSDEAKSYFEELKAIGEEVLKSATIE